YTKYHDRREVVRIRTAGGIGSAKDIRRPRSFVHPMRAAFTATASLLLVGTRLICDLEHVPELPMLTLNNSTGTKWMLRRTPYRFGVRLGEAGEWKNVP